MVINFNLFINGKKNDNHPDRRGTGKDEQGNEYEVAGWLKRTKNGDEYVSCKLSPKRDQPAQSPDTQVRDPARSETACSDDDLPF